MQGAVPTPSGNIELYASETEIRIKGVTGTGTLRFSSKIKPQGTGGEIISKVDNQYELTIENGKAYKVRYQN
jgi:hypothetical protein